jgi:nitrogen fixation/metabolism regulation signal transduction histidine kinase
MRLPGRTERRLTLAILLVAIVPLAAAIFVARNLVDATTSLFYNAEVIAELDRSLNVYNELAKAMKEGLRAKADAIAAQEPLRAAAILQDGPSIEQELAVVFRMYPDLVSISIHAPDTPEADPEGKPEGKIEGKPGGQIGFLDRGHPINENLERTLSVRRPLSDRENTPTMTVVFAAPRGTLDDIARASEFARTYRLLAREKRTVERWYLYAYAALVGITIPIGVLIAIVLARQVTRRIGALATATEAVGAGDLSVRVPVEGQDEITDLARAFNGMLGEVEASRARIEFLQRMGTWQEMARRLAHEIKNPLTPIQLAVQECHRRYDGDSRSYRKLLDMTLEIVEEEVNTLRRLVGEFSNFARLPRAELVAGDLGVYLRDQGARFSVVEGEDEETGSLAGVALEWKIPNDPLPVAFDPIMLHRVLANVLGNAAQAIRGEHPEGGRVQVTTTIDRGFVVIDVDDTGPGVPDDQRDRIFDPYFTTKSDGTGLGLAIVKKVVVEHGGTIEAIAAPGGGARIRIRIPLLGTPASDVALAHTRPAALATTTA